MTTLIIKELNATNALCFKSLHINFQQNKVTQLIGENGVGKSSIPTLLEEVLFNKNSRGLSKSEIKNRFLNENYYVISCLFCKADKEYRVVKTVKSSAKVQLLCNGQDISGHTATQTYKLLQDIIGLDFATFTKLIYQSMESSLDFLKATDANRKKFFMGLFNLSEYSENEEKLKSAHSEAQKELSATKTKMDTVKSWLDKNSNVDMVIKELRHVPELDLTEQENKVIDIKSQLATLERDNVSAKSETARRQHLERLLKMNVAPCHDNYEQLQKVTRDHARVQEDAVSAQTKYRMAKAECDKASNYEEKCSKCGQDLDFEDAARIYEDAKYLLEQREQEFKQLNSKLTQIKHELEECKREQKAYQEYRKHLDSIQQAEASIDNSKPTLIRDGSQLQQELSDLQNDITKAKRDHDADVHYNNQINIHNAKVEEINNQSSRYQQELDLYNSKLTQVSELESDLKILKESFSGKGLVNFKIESLIKSFETEINSNLVNLTDGQFALGFIVEDAKLKLKMYSHSEEVSIKSLSTGEFNKVNMASLLAVRSMMSKMSDVSVNVLFLDEVISVLSATSLETLIDHLLKENLNTFIVSHEYSHPLAEEIHLVKTNNISEIK